LTEHVTGDVLIAGSAGSILPVAVVATNNVLISKGLARSCSSVGKDAVGRDCGGWTIGN